MSQIEEYAKLSCELHSAQWESHEADLMSRAARAIDVLNSPSRNDFSVFMSAKTATESARNAYEAASTRLDLAKMRERMTEIMSQAQPLGDLDIDREKVRQVLHYVACGRLK